MMKKSPVSRLILFTFVFSWLCWSIAMINGQLFNTFPNILFFSLGGSGPTLMALIIVLCGFDAQARRDFWSRLIDPRRIHPAWWLLSLLALPLVLVLGVTLDILLGGALPAMPNLKLLAADPVGIPAFLMMMVISGPLSEELGWRGFVLENFQRRWSPQRTTFTLAALWWAWHIPMFFIRGSTHASWGFFTPMFWLFMIQILLLSIFITLAHNHNGRSVLAAILIHFSYNLMLSLLVPYSPTAFALATLLLAMLVLAALKNYGWKETAAVPALQSDPLAPIIKAG
jgi:uncharacterized protein